MTSIGVLWGVLIATLLLQWFNISAFIVVKRYMDRQFGRYDALTTSIQNRFQHIESLLQQCQQSITLLQNELKNVPIRQPQSQE